VCGGGGGGGGARYKVGAAAVLVSACTTSARGTEGERASHLLLFPPKQLTRGRENVERRSLYPYALKGSQARE
jgi:hypothetical protein